jgi:2-methylisocitrate lyase-like PEP mutase family enzyme
VPDERQQVGVELLLAGVSQGVRPSCDAQASAVSGHPWLKTKNSPRLIEQVGTEPEARSYWRQRRTGRGIGRSVPNERRSTMKQSQQAERFRALHARRPLVLPNAWDAASARVIELAGASAIATTSAAVAWTFGRPDGQRLTRDEMLHAVRLIVGAVSVPVSADVESGYGAGSPDDVAETIRGVVGAGGAGVNLEDSRGGDRPLFSADEQVERLIAARRAVNTMGTDLVINARTDVFLARIGAPAECLHQAIQRGNAYLAAGADCVFVPGVTEAETIEALARSIDGPLNILMKPGTPTVPELARLGVARVSLGPYIAQAALATARRVAIEVLERGTCESLMDIPPFAEVNGMFPR